MQLTLLQCAAMQRCSAGRGASNKELPFAYELLPEDGHRNSSSTCASLCIRELQQQAADDSTSTKNQSQSRFLETFDNIATSQQATITDFTSQTMRNNQIVFSNSPAKVYQVDAYSRFLEKLNCFTIPQILALQGIIRGGHTNLQINDIAGVQAAESKSFQSSETLSFTWADTILAPENLLAEILQFLHPDQIVSDHPLQR